MPAYIIAQAEEVLDPAGLQRYVEEVTPLLAKYGGHYIGFSDQVQALDGDWRPPVVAIIEFPSGDQIRAFWNDPDYPPMKELRHQSARTQLIAFDSPPPA